MKFNKVLKSGGGGADGAQTAEGGANSLVLRYGALKKQLKVMAHVLSQDAEGAPCVLPTIALVRGPMLENIQIVASIACSQARRPARQQMQLSSWPQRTACRVATPRRHQMMCRCVPIVLL